VDLERTWVHFLRFSLTRRFVTVKDKTDVFGSAPTPHSSLAFPCPDSPIIKVGENLMNKPSLPKKKRIEYKKARSLIHKTIRRAERYLFRGFLNGDCSLLAHGRDDRNEDVSACILVFLDLVADITFWNLDVTLLATISPDEMEEVVFDM